jgi:transposase
MRWLTRLTPELRAQTPAPVLALLEAMQTRIHQLQARVAELEARLGQDSTNSSRPPSADPPAARHQRRRRPPSGRPSGGQPGHPFHERPLLPATAVTAVVPLKPSVCRHCRAPLRGTDDNPFIHQVTEIPPPPPPQTTEYQLHTLVCRRCGQATTADLPREVPQRAFGPRLQALIGANTGCYRLSKRQTQQQLEDRHGVVLSLGAIADLEHDLSDALAEPVAELRAYVRTQPAVHADETSFRQGTGRQKHWLWAAATSLATVFTIQDTRAATVIQALLGRTFAGILHSDRYKGYNWLPPGQRQLCWAHLRRDWLAFIDRRGTSHVVGQRLLALTDQMFTWWHRVRDGTLSRVRFRLQMRPLQAEVGQLLRRGAACAQSPTAGSCADILQREPALWTFVDHAGVEPTNNRVEQLLRHWVLWRRTSHGTQSAWGSLYMERLMTVVTTLRQQGRDVQEYLTAALEAKLHGTRPPSLVPPTQAEPTRAAS